MKTRSLVRVSGRCPSAFTLIELLVVIAIIATAMIISQLVLEKGMSKMRNPARTVIVQEI